MRLLFAVLMLVPTLCFAWDQEKEDDQEPTKKELFDEDYWRHQEIVSNQEKLIRIEEERLELEKERQQDAWYNRKNDCEGLIQDPGCN